MEKSQKKLPVGHSLMPAFTIATLSVVLALGLGILKILGRLEGWFSGWLFSGDAFSIHKALPGWMVWSVAVLLSFGLSLSMLTVAGTWRRVVLWVSAVILVAAWGPVLALAAHAPQVAAPWVAVTWAGLCSLVYTRNHRMPSDEIPDGKTA